MKRGLKIAYGAAAAVFALGVAGSIYLLSSPASDTAEVVRDGEVLYRLELSSTKDQRIKIEYGDSYNIIEISDGQIKVIEAGCPDNTCVKMGRLKSGAPIVCLPNHLVIRFTKDSGDVDAIAK